ncbi:cytochrome P450 [Nocardia sp. NPDC127526]|uniref:cytochrome P450 n=1 Tax=Nocardia sp. NPDC127526 TaxID=3345393 RepID=UPI00363A8805
MVDEVIAARDRDGTGGGHADMLELMLTATDPATGGRLDRRAVRAECPTFLVAGHETSSGATAFELWELARHPEIAERVRAEIAARCPDSVGGPLRLEFEDVARLRYLRRVVDEVLRLHPVAPGFFRRPRFCCLETAAVSTVAARRHRPRMRTEIGHRTAWQLCAAWWRSGEAGALTAPAPRAWPGGYTHPAKWRQPDHARNFPPAGQHRQSKRHRAPSAWR